MKATIEFTDTMAGEANYSWVIRHEIPVGNKSDVALVRALKAAVGLSGVPCKREAYGDMIVLKPYRSCTVAFITFE